MMELFGIDSHFYHGSIRRYVALFGSIFSDIYIKRVSEAKEEYIKIPIRYGPGNMYMKVPQDKSREVQQIAKILPAMAFELDNIYKDVSRKTNPMNRILSKNNDVDAVSGDVTKNFQLNRVPYNFIFKLTIRTKNSDDMMQIVEQIIPAFDGNLYVTVEDTTDITVNQDIAIILDELDMSDNYDDEMQSRLIEWTLTFELKGYLYKKTQTRHIVSAIDIMAGFDWTAQEVIESVEPTDDEQSDQSSLSSLTNIIGGLPTAK